MPSVSLEYKCVYVGELLLGKPVSVTRRNRVIQANSRESLHSIYPEYHFG